MAQKPDGQKALETNPTVLIVGAGAVGLMLANVLGQQGIKTLVLEQERERRPGSRAIGLTPPSLELLDTLHLAQRFIAQGVPVDTVEVYGSRTLLGSLLFERLRGCHPFILSIPQRKTEKLLEDNLANFDSVTLLKGWEVLRLRDWKNCPVIEAVNRAEQKEQHFQADMVCGCDGKNSLIRRQLGMAFPGAAYGQTYLMADHRDETSLGRKACFYFTDKGPVESFPLPDGLRRWLIDTPCFLEHPELGYLEREVAKRTGIRLSPATNVWMSAFGVQHFMAPQFGAGPVLLCGDAAHVMSPIGGQGMNVGLADAAHAALVIRRQVESKAPVSVFPADYQRSRRKSAALATRHAAFSMRLGTLRGKVTSAVRNTVIRLALKWFQRDVLSFYAMLTIPNCFSQKGKKKR